MQHIFLKCSKCVTVSSSLLLQKMLLNMFKQHIVVVNNMTKEEQVVNI